MQTTEKLDTPAPVERFVHTPGPWAVFDRSPDEIILDDVMTETRPHRRICNVYGGTRDGGVNAANARLISAAPDMLAALEKARETIWAWHGKVAWDLYQASPVMTAINAAIDKATGSV